MGDPPQGIPHAILKLGRLGFRNALVLAPAGL